MNVEQPIVDDCASPLPHQPTDLRLSSTDSDLSDSEFAHWRRETSRATHTYSDDDCMSLSVDDGHCHTSIATETTETDATAKTKKLINSKVTVRLPNESISTFATLQWFFCPEAKPADEYDPEFKYYCSRCVIKSHMCKSPCACINYIVQTAMKHESWPKHLRSGCSLDQYFYPRCFLVRDNHNVVQRCRSLRVSIPDEGQYLCKNANRNEGVSDCLGEPTTISRPLRHPPKYKKSTSTSARTPCRGERIDSKTQFRSEKNKKKNRVPNVTLPTVATNNRNSPQLQTRETKR